MSGPVPRSRRKVLFVGHGSGLAGAERSVVETAGALGGEGMEVFVLLPEWGPACERLAENARSWAVERFSSARRGSELARLLEEVLA